MYGCWFVCFGWLRFGGGGFYLLVEIFVFDLILVMDFLFGLKNLLLIFD